MSDIYRGADASVKDEFATEIKKATRALVDEMLEKTSLKEGDIFIVGCSSSEILGSNIGKGSSYEAAKIVFGEIYPILKKKGIFLAAQCCEHLNRAIIIEEECAEKYGYEIVNVKPQPKAGGSFATATYANLKSPVAVEHISAKAGIDIGGTLIGMHLRHVAVPVRASISKIGEANVLCARTRPKFIGGSRAVYED